MFRGEAIQLSKLDEGFLELRFDRRDAGINKLDLMTIREWREATNQIAAAAEVRGVLVTSAQGVFIVGADINEFDEMFRLPAAELSATVQGSNKVAVAFEDLAVPTVVAINGYALGGGLEMTLTAALRVMSTSARIGLPEVKLGLFPGLGGTIRMTRLAGPAAAVDWISTGRFFDAAAAREAGVVDEICEPEALRETALDCLRNAASGRIDWRVRQERKRQPVPLGADVVQTIFQACKAKVVAASPMHQPAALMTVEMMEQCALRNRANALILESDTFARVAQTPAAAALIQGFHNEQVIKKLFRRHAREARPVKQCAVVGAGIMGSGIAATSASHGTPVLLKDVSRGQLDAGMSALARQLARKVDSGRIRQDDASRILASITTQTDYAGFNSADIAIEAVLENLQVKRTVLSELEEVVRDDTIVASNTSSLRIDALARSLRRPHNFVGMHFFNPVPAMALVEVIRGGMTGDAAVATAVGYAAAMGKTPIVVRDCPGFLVNRILTAYLRAFLQLISDGADFARIDRLLEDFGWPMGPAHLEDVMGLDVSSRGFDLISAGYQDRMPPLERHALHLMVEHKRYGRKNGIGFYRYEADPAGKLRKLPAADTHDLLGTLQPAGSRYFSDEEIIERMMLPLVIEAAHALEDGIVATPAELDMALVLGIGFPKYLGGALMYADRLGLDRIVGLSDQYAHLGAQYRATQTMRGMAEQGAGYYGARRANS